MKKLERILLLQFINRIDNVQFKTLLQAAYISIVTRTKIFLGFVPILQSNYIFQRLNIEFSLKGYYIKDFMLSSNICAVQS